MNELQKVEQLKNALNSGTDWVIIYKNGYWRIQKHNRSSKKRTLFYIRQGNGCFSTSQLEQMIAYFKECIERGQIIKRRRGK